MRNGIDATRAVARAMDRSVAAPAFGAYLGQASPKRIRPAVDSIRVPDIRDDYPGGRYAFFKLPQAERFSLLMEHARFLRRSGLLPARFDFDSTLTGPHGGPIGMKVSLGQSKSGVALQAASDFGQGGPRGLHIPLTGAPLFNGAALSGMSAREVGDWSIALDNGLSSLSFKLSTSAR